MVNDATAMLNLPGNSTRTFPPNKPNASTPRSNVPNAEQVRREAAATLRATTEGGRDARSTPMPIVNTSRPFLNQLPQWSRADLADSADRRNPGRRPSRQFARRHQRRPVGLDDVDRAHLRFEAHADLSKVLIGLDVVGFTKVTCTSPGLKRPVVFAVSLSLR